MRKRFLLSLLVALLTTLSTLAYDFQSGDLYYNITSDTTVQVTCQQYNSTNYQGLTTATIPETVTYNGTTYSVTSIGNAAFRDCSSLISIILPNSVTSIGNYAFSSCTFLTSIILPYSVTSIGYRAFAGCTSLPIVDNLRYADTYLVEAVDKSLSTYTIKAETKWIGSNAFNGCSSLTSIILPNSVTSIGDEAFQDCSSLTSITIPNSVTSIGYYAFAYCFALTSIILPNSVTSIGGGAFCYCSSLTSIAIPYSVTSIGNGAFAYCSSLTSITIPNSVTSIGDYMFCDCSSLTSITCLATTPPTCGTDCFRNVTRTIPLYVPAESVEEYKAADTWKEFDVQALLSTDATLSSLTYDGMSVPSFDAGTLYYTVDLPSETVAVPVVDAVANDSGATLTIHQAAALPGEASVEVLAADKTTRQTYTIYFSKKSTPTGISDSPDTTETASDKGATKLLRDGQVLILRNGVAYDMMGQTL